MYNSKLVNIFIQITRKEKQNLKLWVYSPIANSREDVKMLYDFIYSRRTLTQNSLNRELAFYYVYPKLQYSDKQMRYLISFATQCLEDFLAYNQWKESKVNQQLDLIKNIKQKKLDLYAIKNINETSLYLHSQNNRNSSFYIQNYYIESERFVLQSKNKRYENFNFQSISNNLHFFTIAEILKNACIAISFEQVSGQNFDFYLIDSCIKIVETNSIFKECPPVYIYYLCYVISTNGNDTVFKELYAAILKLEHYFNKDELKDILLLAINFCIKELNIGKQNYAHYAYQLYIYGLQKEYLLDNGELSRFTFKNIVFIGIKKLKDFKSVESFIENFIHTINIKYRENTVLFNKATLHVEKKEYKKAMRILQQVEFEDVLWNINAKSMLLRIYYEEKEYDLMLSLIKNFKLYLHRQKESTIYKERYMIMMNYCSKLYRALSNSKQKKQELLQEINSNTNLLEKEWFIEMATKL